VYGAGTLAQFYGIFDREYLKLPAFDYILYQEVCDDLHSINSMIAR
jgi:hypothetical protein